MDHVLAQGEKFPLPGDLERDRSFHGAKRVQVLYLHLGPQRGAPLFRHRDVRLDAHLAFFHVGIRNAEIAENKLQLARETRCFFRALYDRLGHELHKRNAGAVEIHQTRLALVSEPAGVFFKMDARNGDACERSAFDKRFVVLRYLVALREIGIEIVLTVEFSASGPEDRAAERETNLEDGLDCSLIDGRKRAGVAQTDRADARVRVPLRGVIRTVAEHLRRRF